MNEIKYFNAKGSINLNNTTFTFDMQCITI